MTRYRMLAWGFGVALIALAGRAEAGWVIDEVARPEGEAGSRMQVLIQANRMKTVLLGADGRPEMVMVLDLNAETFTHVDVRQRRYGTATFEEMGRLVRDMGKAAQAQMAEAMQQMREAMKNMPPEQRRQVEEMLRSQMGAGGGPAADCKEPQTEARRTTQRATIAGYPAVRYDVLADGQLQSEMWIASGINVGRELDARKLERFVAVFAGADPTCGQGRAGLGWHRAAMKLFGEGYPVRTVHRGGSGYTIEVVKADNRSIPAAEFQPPAGFAQATMQEVLGR